MEKEYLNQRDLVDILPFGKKKVYTLLRQKKIPAVRVGRDYLISRKDLNNWYQRSKRI